MMLVLACSLGPVRLLAQEPASATETITIDAHAPSHPFPHYWEQRTRRSVVSHRLSAGRATASRRSLIAEC